MIKPLFFPNTYIQKSIVDCLLKGFEQVSVYKPAFDTRSAMGNGERNNSVVSVTPVSGDEDRLDTFLKEYRDWASFHKGKGGQFLKGNVDIPFFDPTWASQLRTEIQIKVENESGGLDGESDNHESLLMARAFLQIAQDYDEKNLEISEEFKELERREKDLLGCLHGGEEDDDLEGQLLQAPEHQGDTWDAQIEKRLAAWALLFEDAWPDPEKTGDGLYITGIRDALEHIAEYVPGLEHVGDLTLCGKSADEISTLVENLVSCDWNSERDILKQGLMAANHNEGFGVISLYIYSEKSPYEIFCQLSGKKEELSGKKENRKNIRNTVLGFVKK